MSDTRMTTCPICNADDPVYRNPVGNHADEDQEPEYEWCSDQWHEPFFFDPPLRNQVMREIES